VLVWGRHGRWRRPVPERGRGAQPQAAGPRGPVPGPQPAAGAGLAAARGAGDQVDQRPHQQDRHAVPEERRAGRPLRRLLLRGRAPGAGAEARAPGPRPGGGPLRAAVPGVRGRRRPGALRPRRARRMPAGLRGARGPRLTDLLSGAERRGGAVACCKPLAVLVELMRPEGARQPAPGAGEVEGDPGGAWRPHPPDLGFMCCWSADLGG
ncbi:unnamed protein product, partial [Prorocentrum cordatum]